MTNAAIAVGQPPWEKNNASGTRHLDRGAEMREPPRHPARPQVVGEVLEELPFDAPRPDNRVVAHHRRDHEREVLVELGRGRAEPDHQADELGGDDHVHPVAGEQERHRERRVHLAAGGQEDHLVAQAEQARADQGSSRSATSAARRPWCPTPGSDPCRRRTARPAASRAARAYSAASTGVRVVPFVSGTRFGHGGSRMVLGRNQYRIEPIGGKNRLFSGPKPQPSPMTSNSIV